MRIAEKLTQIAENEQKVYDAGYAAGNKSGNDGFWDSYLNGGDSVTGDYIFAGDRWTDETFKPCHNIKPTSGLHMFSGTGIADLVALLDSLGVSIDFSGYTGTSYLAISSDHLETLPAVDCKKRINMNYFLYNCPSLREIEKVILKEDGSQSFYDYSFCALPALEEIRFAGVIGQNNLDFSASAKLSHDSLMSIINALKDYSGSGTSYTVTLGATNLAKLTAAEKALATDKGWTLE